MPAVITSITPPRGRTGDTVFIDGTGFSATNNTVRVDGQLATINSQSTTQIEIVVPGGITQNFQVIVRVINNDDSSQWDRFWFVLLPQTTYETKIIEPQQPGPVEDPATEVDTVAEAKDYERLVGYAESWTQEILPEAGSGNPNTTSGATKIGTKATAFVNVSPSSDHVQSVLEALDDQVGGASTIIWGDGSLGDVVISSHVTTSGRKNYRNLTVQTGASLNATARRKLVVLATGDITIEGTGAIHADGRGQAGADGGAGTDADTATLGGDGGSTAPFEMRCAAAGGGGGGGSGGAQSGSTADAGDGGDGQNRSGALDGLGGSTGGAGGLGVAGASGNPGASPSRTDLDSALKTHIQDALFESRHLFLGAAGGGAGGGGTGGRGSTPGGGLGGAGGTAGSQTGSGLGHGGDGASGGSGGASEGGGGGGGGASGAGGGSLETWCRGDLSISASGRISADGGDGGDGGNGGSPPAGLRAGGGAGASGASGGGGRLLAIYGGTPTNVDASHVHASAGAAGVAGTGGAGTRTGGNGGSGPAGEVGYAVFLKI